MSTAFVAATLLVVLMLFTTVFTSSKPTLFDSVRGTLGIKATCGQLQRLGPENLVDSGGRVNSRWSYALVVGRCGVLEGLELREVETILGEPQETHGRFASWRLGYPVDWGPGGNKYLTVELDRDGIVKDVRAG